MIVVPIPSMALRYTGSIFTVDPNTGLASNFVNTGPICICRLELIMLVYYGHQRVAVVTMNPQ